MNKFRKNSANNDFRNRKPTDTTRRQMLDMRRQKYFRFDLDDLLTEYQLGDNKNTVAAALLNKMSSHSMAEAFEYVSRLEEAETLSSEKAIRLKTLLQRYSKWR